MTSAATADGAGAVVAPLRRTRLVGVLAGGVALTTLVFLWGLTRGQPDVGSEVVWNAITSPGAAGDDPAALLIRELRLPRLVMALVAGAALAMAGVIMQDSLRNPIADPSLLGIAQAASLVVAVALFFPEVVSGVATPALALVAGLLAGGLLVLVARSIREPVRLVLIGVVLASLFGMITSIVILVVPSEALTQGLPVLLRFTIGSVSGTSWERVAAVVPWIAVAVPLALVGGRILNLLQLGDDVAAALGLRVTRARFGLLAVAVLLVAPVVAVAGPLAFIALLSPHVARLVLRTTNAYAVLAASAVIGALVAILADTAGRLLFFPYEIPAGIWTILVVGPVAVWLARSRLRTPAVGVPAA